MDRIIAQRASISITGTADNVVVASDPNRRIFIWQFFVVNGHASQDVNITLKEGTTAVSGAYLLKAGGGSHTALGTGVPWAVVPAGSDFVITTDASGTLKGAVYFTKEAQP